MIVPNKAVKMTKTAVTAGIPPIFLTVLVYLGAKKLYIRFPRVYTSPLLITPAVLVVLLLLVNVPYQTYNLGGGLLTEYL